MLKVAISIIVGVGVYAAILIDLAYPDLGRHNLILLARHHAVPLELAFIFTFCVVGVVSWAMEVMNSLSAIRRLEQSPSKDAFDLARNQIFRTFSGSLIAPIVLQLNRDDDPGISLPGSDPVATLDETRHVRAELWRAASRHLALFVAFLLLVAFATGLATASIAPMGPLSLDAVILAVASLVLVGIVPVLVGWAWIDRAMERAADTLVVLFARTSQQHLPMTTAPLIPWNGNTEILDDDRSAVGRQLDRIDRGIAEAEITIKEDLRTLVSVISTLTSSLGPTMEDAVERHGSERWRVLDVTLGQIKEVLRELAVAVASRPIAPPQLNTVTGQNGDASAIAGKVRAALSDLGTAAH